MDKYEYKIRSEEIKELISNGEYAQAVEIADTIDWRRVKSVMMLCTISDLYKINRRYEDARNLLMLAYERRPGGRTICYSLCELSIKMGDYVQAVDYYKEFIQVAPKDSGRFILQYKMYEAQEVRLEERIEVLEELKKCDYREKWAYELAYLYHRVGLATRCVEECDELILWFGEGKYVVKAMELKMLHQPLTPEQQKKYDSHFSALQGMTEQPQEDVQTEEQEVAPAADTQVYEPVAHEEAAEDEMDIHVKTMDVGQYNTINLQAELAAGLREVLSEEGASEIEDPITRSIMAPMLDADTDSLVYPDMGEIREEDVESAGEEIEESEVFFGETAEIGTVNPEVVLQETFVVEHIVEEPAMASEAMQEATEQEHIPEEILEDVAVVEQEPEVGVADVTAEIVMEQLRQAQVKRVVEPDASQQVLHEEPPKALAGVLSQESDGQISLVMPERESVEKQITGQISIDDILAEWERMKKENQEKREAEVRQHVLQQTGAMFTEFEEAVRDGLLEQLERGRSVEEVTEDIAEEATEDIIEEAVEEVTEEMIEETAESEYLAEAYLEEAEAVVETVEETVEQDVDVEYTEESDEAEPTEEYAESEYPEAESVYTEEEYPENIEVTEDEVTEDSAEEAVEEMIEEAVEEVTEEIIEETAETEYLTEESETEAAEEYPETEYAEETEALADEAVESETTEAAEEIIEETDYPDEEEYPEEEDSDEEDYPEEEYPEDADYPEEVEREPARIRALTREEKELYGPFIQSKSAKEQIVQAIDGISMAAYTGNLIVTGEEGMDTISLAKNMMKEIQSTDSNFTGKVAKISGHSLNNKKVADTINQLKNGALIISKASEMNDETADALYNALQQETLGIVIVMEDTRKLMDRFLAAHEELSSCFTARVDVQALSNDRLVAFGKQYARECEYSIDELGVLQLHARIEELQTIEHAVTVVEVKRIVDEAIRHANRKTLGHFFDVLLAKRYDSEDMIILTEKDFEA